MTSQDFVLRAVNLDGGYVIGSSEKELRFVHAVRNVSLNLNYNEILGIAGESGCGKSTLAKILYGAVDPPLVLRRGSIYLHTSEGRIVDITKLDKEDLAKRIWWREISYIPQNSMNVLNPMKRIRDTIIETFKFHGIEISKDEVTKYVRDLFDFVGLPTDVLNAYPHQLSGGMRQRVVITLAMMLNPRIIIADEPTTAVDVVTQLNILTFLREYQNSKKSSIVIISHDMGVHAYMDTAIAIMYAGSIVEYGKSEEVFQEPLHPYTKMLMSSLIVRGDKGLKRGIPGSPPDLRNPPSGCKFHPRCPFAMDICRKEEPPIIEISKNRFVTCWLYAKR
ncbi:ABC transporter ATP-binding protein [Ignisphaera sp. 4213-co]|uniref:ABC transporter ATP-binding protein n=1 Tax=Ignisphaera cupida TaxID=3050454 RepID=A0ABD4Z599_9CREN|nr:ABC transporter ATP-binding protein [Ignisphaera sp. 4213-co]MDK6028496.1 ABC transporter ATP-binding protein [Ignisphaera sp. 4213-co]